MKNTIIAPSVLAADFGNLQRDIEMINAVKPTGSTLTSWTAFCSEHLLRNACFGIHKHAKKTIDVHLMIVDPDRYIKTFADLGLIS
jgi:ribulose-phosphate 3-epimerase